MKVRYENDLKRPEPRKAIAKNSGVSASFVSRILSGRLEKAIVVFAEKIFESGVRLDEINRATKGE